ncbi:invasion associated locus B family protein [Pseudochelatococcus sp. B33]
MRLRWISIGPAIAMLATLPFAFATGGYSNENVVTAATGHPGVVAPMLRDKPLYATAEERDEIEHEQLGRTSPPPVQTEDVPPAVSQPDNKAASLPNGTSSINEIYGDWTVSCLTPQGQKVCLLSQVQSNSRTGQRSFAIELRVPRDGKTEGIMVMPFGLGIDEGVRLKIDEQSLDEGARFSTCLPYGCIVPISFPTVTTDAMMRGTSLFIIAPTPNGGEPHMIEVSLDGFGEAFRRVIQLDG